MSQRSYSNSLPTIENIEISSFIEGIIYSLKDVIIDYNKE